MMMFTAAYETVLMISRLIIGLLVFPLVILFVLDLLIYCNYLLTETSLTNSLMIKNALETHKPINIDYFIKEDYEGL